MTNPLFTNDQIAFAPKQAESGVPEEALLGKLAVSRAALFRRYNRLDRMGVDGLRCVKFSKEEDEGPKTLVSNLSPDKQVLQDVLKKAEACTFLRGY